MTDAVLNNEIERRWLVDPAKLAGRQLPKAFVIQQGYLTSPETTGPVVRIRHVANEGSIIQRGFHTVKGYFPEVSGPLPEGAVHELEHEIPSAMATSLLPLCLARLKKHRHSMLLKQTPHLIELDIFQEKLEGLVIAEIELPSIDAPLTVPDYFGPEITGIKPLSNVAIAFYPDAAMRLAQGMLHP